MNSNHLNSRHPQRFWQRPFPNMRKIDIGLLRINYRFCKNSSLVIKSLPGFVSSLYLCFSSTISFNPLALPKYEDNVFTADLILCHRSYIILKLINHIEKQASCRELQKQISAWHVKFIK